MPQQSTDGRLLSVDPLDELAEVLKRAQELLPALFLRLAAPVAEARDPQVVERLMLVEIHRLLEELAEGASEPARRALLGLEEDGSPPDGNLH